MPSLASLLPFGLALIMAQVGLTLAGADFARLVRTPRAVVVGLVAQMGVLPLLALALVRTTSLPPELALGVVLIAGAPGGVTSNLITLVAGGDVALAVTITAISTLASAITLPLLLGLAAGLAGTGVGDFAVPLPLLIRGLVVTTVAPLLLGMAVRRFAPGFAARFEPRLRRVSIAIFAAMVLYTFASNAPAFRAHGLALAPAMLALDAVAMAAAVALALAAGLSRPQAVAIGLETGLQNAAVAIVVALTVLGRPELAIAPVIYAFTMNIGAVAFVPLARRWVGAAGAAPAPAALEPRS